MDLSIVFCESLPEGIYTNKSHEIPLNPIKPPFFLWFSYANNPIKSPKPDPYFITEMHRIIRGGFRKNRGTSNHPSQR